MLSARLCGLYVAFYRIFYMILLSFSAVTYAAPKAWWWSFAALRKADFKLQHADKEKDVELSAVMWVKFHDMK